MGKYSHHGRKYLTQRLVAPRSKVPTGRKYWIEIFGHRSTKTGKKLWREILRITGARFRSEIPSPVQNFWILPNWWHSGRKYQIEIFGRRAAKTVKKSAAKTVKNPVDKLYAPLVQSSEVKYSLQIRIFEFYPSGPNCHPGTLELCSSGA